MQKSQHKSQHSELTKYFKILKTPILNVFFRTPAQNIKHMWHLEIALLELLTPDTQLYILPSLICFHSCVLL